MSTAQQISDELRDLLVETFERSHGIYLYPHTSLFETLDTVTADIASRPICTEGTSIAAQCAHTAFYLRVLQDHIRGTISDNVDWEHLWKTVKVVSEAEWDAIRVGLRDSYAETLQLLSEQCDWAGENTLSGFLAILAHSAYHLGVIRQATQSLDSRGHSTESECAPQ